MPTLTITLPFGLPTASASCMVVLGDDTSTVIRHVEAPLSLLPDAADSEIVAVVPAEQLSWHQLELPKGTLDRGLFQDGGATRLRAVLDGLLEDRLLDETAQLHFALQPQAKADAPVWVAACNRAWLQAWMQALEQAGRPAARIVPEVQPSASGTASVWAVGTSDQARLLCATPLGVSVLPLAPVAVNLLALGETPIDAVAEPGVAQLAEHLFKTPVRLQTAPQRALAAAQSAWDLAQFEFLRTRQARTRKQLATLVASLWRAPHWKPARWSAIALVVVNLVGLQAWAWKEQAALSAKRSVIREVLTSTFPDVRVVVDAPVQMARALADLQRQSGTASSLDMETMLGLFGTLALENIAPEAIEFIAGELRLKVPPIPDADVAQLATRLQTHGYTARMRGDSLVITPERRP
jgi:general secretion pathway protein L